MVPRPVTSASISWEFVKNANLRLHSTPTESEIQKLRPGNLCFNKHPGEFRYTLKFESHSAFYWASVWGFEQSRQEGSRPRGPWSTSKKHEVDCDLAARIRLSSAYSQPMSILIGLQMTCIPLNTNLLHIIYMDVDTLMLSFLLFFFLVNYNSDYNVINIETHLTPIVMVKIWGLP